MIYSERATVKLDNFLGFTCLLLVLHFPFEQYLHPLHGNFTPAGTKYGGAIMYFTQEFAPLFTLCKCWLICSGLTTLSNKFTAIETDPLASILLIYKNRKIHKSPYII